MRLFQSFRSEHNSEQRKFYALTEVAYTVVDFLAALLFIAGSVFFFFESLVTAGTWLFLIGSVFFAMKPTIRLWREIKLLQMADYRDIAEQS